MAWMNLFSMSHLEISYLDNLAFQSRVRNDDDKDRLPGPKDPST
jgi:hypothetical protein